MRYAVLESSHWIVAFAVKYISVVDLLDMHRDTHTICVWILHDWKHTRVAFRVSTIHQRPKSIDNRTHMCDVCGYGWCKYPVSTSSHDQVNRVVARWAVEPFCLTWLWSIAIYRFIGYMKEMWYDINYIISICNNFYNNNIKLLEKKTWLIKQNKQNKCVF